MQERTPGPSERPSDGHTAYQDDARYTAPEMRRGHGENLEMRPHHGSGGLAAAMAMPAAGGPLGTDGVAEPLLREAPSHVSEDPRFGLLRRAVAAIGHRLRSPAERPILGPAVRTESQIVGRYHSGR
jgi:hypothetical protein